MAFLKTANASEIRLFSTPRHFSEGWSKTRVASSNSEVNANLIGRASDILQQQFDPKDFLLTHATIVASVDTEDVTTEQASRYSRSDFQANRKFANFRVKSECEPWLNNNHDGWERELLLNTYRTFVGAENYVEHVQIPEQSKGKIIDAVARDIGPSVYIDILVATHRKHAALIQDIESGKMNSMSMGCHIAYSQCTKCGHVAQDETQMCHCIRYEKGNKFYDEFSQMHRVAELCGHRSDIESNRFIEASWVAVPAFQGAVARNILSPIEVSSTRLRQAQLILSQPPQSWDAEEMVQYAKAASLLARKAGFDFGDDEEGGGDDSGDSGGGNIIDELEDAVIKGVKTKVRKQIRDKMDPPPEVDESKSTTEDNDNVVNASLYETAVNALVKSASCDASLLNGVAEINQAFDIKVPVEIYQASLKVGSTRQYKSLKRFVRACGHTLGRTPTLDEAKTLIRLSNLLAARQSG